jgi:hypothetical protein
MNIFQAAGAENNIEKKNPKQPEFEQSSVWCQKTEFREPAPAKKNRIPLSRMTSRLEAMRP